MAILSIRVVPDPTLKEPAKEVTVFNQQLRKLLGDMTETMYAAHGIGLAAPQVGILQRVAVVHAPPDTGQKFHLINPVITAREGSVDSEEGCLSIPDYHDSIKRAEQISVRYQDEFGTEHTLDADGILAICIQHEVDHLDGILFVDHLSRLKREFYKRWLKKFIAGDIE
jgi:peptide deformylase